MARFLHNILAFCGQPKHQRQTQWAPKVSRKRGHSLRLTTNCETMLLRPGFHGLISRPRRVAGHWSNNPENASPVRVAEPAVGFKAS